MLREHGVSSVIAGNESGVELTDQLSVELGTPGNGMSRPTARRNKYDMVLAMHDAGLATRDHCLNRCRRNHRLGRDDRGLSDRHETGLQLRHGQRGALFVPGTGSRRARQIMTSVDRYGKANTVVLAQEFLEGDEYFVNTVSRNGKHHIVDIWRYFKCRVPGGNFIYDYDEPMAPGDPDTKTLELYTHQVLDALEIRNGAGHTEIMLTARGPVLVECAARMGGGQTPEIITRCFGTNQVDLLALSVARPDEFDRLPATEYQLLQRPRFVSLMNPRDRGVSRPMRRWPLSARCRPTSMPSCGIPEGTRFRGRSMSRRSRGSYISSPMIRRRLSPTTKNCDESNATTSTTPTRNLAEGVWVEMTRGRQALSTLDHIAIETALGRPPTTSRCPWCWRSMCERRLDDRCGTRSTLSRRPCRVLRAELRHQPPTPTSLRRPSAATALHADQPGVLPFDQFGFVPLS